MIKNCNQMILVFILLISVSSCQNLKLSSKNVFDEGIYRSYLNKKKLNKVYVVPSEETITVYSLKDHMKHNIDTGDFFIIALAADSKPVKFEAYTFRKYTFDIDAISVLAKYRTSVNDFPPQLNNSFNGSVYLGLRTDWYKLKYKETPLHLYKKSISHHGYSLGFFTGLGTERIDPYNTENGITIEYDGIVNLSGFAAIVAVNNLTFGLALGFDHLLDKNKKFWIYSGKPWLGLGVGLNLN